MNMNKWDHVYICWLGICLLGCFLTSSCSTEPSIPPTESELVAAILARQADRADSLLQAGVSPQSRDEEGTPVLILAVNEGLTRTVKKLVEAGADVNARRKAYFQSTALMEVGVRNDTALAGWLLDRGADLHLQDNLGDTPLNWACYYGHVELVAMYLDRGADWLVGGKQGTAVDIALHRGHRKLIRYFIERGAGEAIGAEAARFIAAVNQNDLGTVQEAIREGMDPDQTDELGTPALVLAAGLGHEQIVQYLLRSGADKNGTNRIGETAMARAARYGHEATVNRLLTIGADPELAGYPYFIRPIITAAQAGETGIVQELLASNVDPNVQEGINGYTPLMLATAGGFTETVKALLAGGASPYIKSFEGAGLYDMLRYSNNPEIGALIREQLLEDE